MKSNFKITIPLAIAMTLISIIYQRATGPTYPKKFTLDESAKASKIKLPRSQGGEINAVIDLPFLYEDMKAVLYYKRYPTNDEWTQVELTKKDKRLVGSLPFQPPAGKLTYHLDLSYQGKTQRLGTRDKPIYIRYKGEVPTFILAPHIFFMFLSMLLSSLAGFEAIFNTKSFRKIGFATTGCLMVGGMILGPIVQKYAFGVYWAGFPYDWDLTDNKLLLSVIFWVAAAILNFKKSRALPTVIAALVLIMMYSIPHSMVGSQYNYEEGRVETDK